MGNVCDMAEPIPGIEFWREPIRGMGPKVEYAEIHSRNGCAVDQEWVDPFEGRSGFPFEYCIRLHPFLPIQSGIGLNPFEYCTPIPFLGLPEYEVWTGLSYGTTPRACLGLLWLIWDL